MYKSGPMCTVAPNLVSKRRSMFDAGLARLRFKFKMRRGESQATNPT